MNSKLTAFALIATNVLEGRICVCSSGDDRSILPETLGGGDRIQRLTHESVLCSNVQTVDDRGLPQNRHRILDLSHLHLGIDRRRKRRRQFDAIALESAKTG